MNEHRDEAPGLEELLAYLKQTRGFDFGGYKRSSLMRRIRKRMDQVGVPDFPSYTDHLEVHPDEFGHLFDTILINVTAFFRDPAAWEALATDVVPRLVTTKKPDDPIRVWSAGCASGEEAYTLAIVLAEALGPDQVRERVKIYATDVDEAALLKARHAAYSAKEVEGISPELLTKYFDQNNGLYTFQKDLRRSVNFGRHDLIQDAPISRIDLLVCRNTLMYFNSETQARILDRFHFALNDRGFLFLGKAETLLAYNNAFTPLDLKRRIFVKLPRSNLRDRLLGRVRHNSDDPGNHLLSHVRVREAAFDAGPVGQIVIDVQNILALANERARTMFHLNAGDLGRPLQDLQISYRPVELRSSIDRAYADRRPVFLREVEWTAATGEASFLNIQVVPLIDANNAVLGASIAFTDVTDFRKLQNDLEQSNTELETAYEELQSTNEELETTNEELQSTVEELETTNEELQSTNEELETLNEELQSTNEELETLNTELNQRSEELNEVNTFLESILTSLRAAVVVVDSDLLIQIWNQRAADLWGLRSEEVLQKNLLGLDIGLPAQPLSQPIHQCQADAAAFQEVTVDAVNRRGKAIRCKVTCMPLQNQTSAKRGVILLMEEAGPDGAIRNGL